MKAASRPSRRTKAAAPTGEDVPAAFGRVVEHTLRLRAQFLAAGDGLALDLEMTNSLWQVLASASKEPRTVPQIARRLGLTRQGVLQTVAKLEERGLVTLHPNPDHKRAALVACTNAGQKVATELRRRQAAFAERCAARSGLDAKSLNRLADLLDRLLLAARESDS